MKIFNNLGTETKVTLNSAILVYECVTGRKNPQHDQHQQCIAMVHPVEHGILGPGSAATIQAIESLAMGLMGSAGGLHMLPTHVLAMSFGRIVWHCPPQRREMWFQPQDKFPALRKVSGEFFPQPHLVFQASTSGFRVFALGSEGRPTEKTRLYHAPYWNVNERGSLCIGSTAFPKELIPSSIPGFETAFYQSRFTHPTARGRQCRTAVAHLWPTLAKKRRFPAEQLLRSPYTLADLLNGRH